MSRRILLAASMVAAFACLSCSSPPPPSRNDAAPKTPPLAERYEVSDDHLVWTFHLRDGLKWSGGQVG